MPHDTTSSRGGLTPLASIDRFCRKVFLAAGTDEATADAATRAMMHGTRHGIDSHGVRLLGHYVKGLTEGRLNPRPQIAVASNLGAIASLDADNAHGALATYTAMAHASRLAVDFGIGAFDNAVPGDSRRDLIRQIFWRDLVAVGHDHGAVDRVFQLTNIARPVVLH